MSCQIYYGIVPGTVTEKIAILCSLPSFLVILLPVTFWWYGRNIVTKTWVMMGIM